MKIIYHFLKETKVVINQKSIILRTVFSLFFISGSFLWTRIRFWI